MGLWLQVIGYVAAFALQILILHAMRRGAWRRYPFVFLYVVVDLITNILEITPNLERATGSVAVRRQYNYIFYWDERVMQVLLFLMVLSLIYHATADLPARRSFITLLVCGSVVFALGSLAIHYSPEVTTGRWMNRWTRDMNFCATILDLILWATLIRARKKDQILLMVAGALGLQFTANAIGQALRDLSHGTVDATAFVIVTANLTCLFIWWQAFRLPAAATLPHR